MTDTRAPAPASQTIRHEVQFVRPVSNGTSGTSFWTVFWGVVLGLIAFVILLAVIGKLQNWEPATWPAPPATTSGAWGAKTPTGHSCAGRPRGYPYSCGSRSPTGLCICP